MFFVKETAHPYLNKNKNLIITAISHILPLVGLDCILIGLLYKGQT